MKGNIICSCKLCGNQFTTVKSRIENGRGKFCSKPCANKFKTIDINTRFIKFIDKTNDCWNWIGNKDKDGYGMFEPKIKEARRAHRYSYFINFGEIPKGMCVCHNCDNPSCVNPNHLFLGTTYENVKDRVNKGRTAKGINNGAYTHPEKINKGEQVGTSKLCYNDIIEIRKAATTISRRKLGKLFNVSHNTICRIVNHESWQHVS